MYNTQNERERESERKEWEEVELDRQLSRRKSAAGS